MLILQVKEKHIENLTPEEEFIRGTVGAKCQINFDEFWQGYEKYIVFKRVGYEPINLMVDSLENEIEIPYTILTEIGEFKIGVFGITETETLPTLYSKDIKILYGTDTHGTTPPTYIPSEIDQLRLSKQDKLTAGSGIKIENNVISSDYELLENKPQINGVELLGNKSLTDLGIDIPTKTSELENDSGFIDDTAFENYYTKTEVDEKTVVDQTYNKNSQNAQSGIAVAEALSGYVMAEVGKGLSSNDFTNEDKEKLYSALQNENIDKTYNPTSENAQSGKAVAQAVSAEQNRANNTFSNALKGTASGSAILIDDVSPVTHEMSVKISSDTVTDLTAVRLIKKDGSGKIISEHTPNADGTVDGVTSLYPNTTLTTDTEGVIIECEYNKDINIVLKHININTWKDVQDTVRAGLGYIRFPVGYEFTTTDSDTGVSIAWVVRGHNHHTPANSRLTHSMSLEMKYVYSNANGSQKAVQYDAQEALYYAEDGLSAGTYHFTVANQAWYEADNGKTFQFTLENAVPAGGQVVVSATYNQALEGKSVKTYSSPSSTATIETTTLTEGSAGADLGTTNGAGNVNHLHRIVFGSNNYAQSAARQWLNSAAAADGVWTPTNKFDRAPSWATTYNGFMHGLPADFLAVVEPAVIPCRTNGVCECASLDGTEFTINQVYNLTDKFFLLSRPEIYGSWDNTTYKDGELLDYYDGLTNEERKKYDNGGTVHHAWLRSPYPYNAHDARIVNTDGSMNSSTAYNSHGVAPACIIA